MYNFTLIIPTHNRHSYLSRSIEYFSNLEAKVIYCDSSKDKYRGFIADNMIYLHLPDKKFGEKILIALEKVNTNYVALCADDDFIIINSLYKGVSILEKNKDFKTVVGEYIFFYDKFDGYFYKTHKNLPQDITFDSKRNAELFFGNYHQILWAMYDKIILVKSFKIITEANFSNDNFIELTIGAVVCNFGGIKFLNNIWGVRELSNKEHWGNRHERIANIYSDKNIKNDFRLFKTYIDKITFQGYSNRLLKSYLRLSFVRKSKMILKALSKKNISKRLIRLIKSYFKRKEPKNSYQSVEIAKLTSGELLNLEKIKTILNNFE